MKKGLKIAAITVGVIIILMFLLPFAFQGKIADIVKTEGNKMLNAQFDFKNLNISLFRNFPQASVTLEDFWLKGTGEFANDTLVQAGEVTAAVNLFSLFGDSGYDISKIFIEGLRMPGAMCGLWGICGAITSIGAALAIIDGTGPLSTDGTWGNHMQFTSKAIGELGTINGPRCCKRDAMIAFKNGIDYVNAHYGVILQYEQMQCGFTDFNEQCIKERCPFYE